MSSPHPNADVRMRGFAERATVEAALAWLDAQLASLPAEEVTLAAATRRVLARDIVSRVDVPTFDRAMMDGFAVRAADTLGASAYNRLPLAVIGECLPGRLFSGQVAAQQAVRIMTGAPMPAGADAVLPAEETQANATHTWALGEVSPGKHVGRVGEDVRQGDTILAAGRVLRPQDLGVLSSVGIAQVPVVRRPRVRIVITGDELLPAGALPQAARIADANGPMLAALVARDGGRSLNPGIVPDCREAILAAFETDADIVLVSGGSSVGQEDHAPTLLAEHGELAIHGVAMRPSSPVGLGRLGRLGERLVVLLPGNPVSCLCAYDFFAGRAIRALGGYPRGSDFYQMPYRRTRARLARKLVSAVGRLDYARVKFVEDAVEPLAISGASILSSTTRADGFVIIPADLEGYPAAAEVDVYLYDDAPPQ